MPARRVTGPAATTRSDASRDHHLPPPAVHRHPRPRMAELRPLPSIVPPRRGLPRPGDPMVRRAVHGRRGPDPRSARRPARPTRTPEAAVSENIGAVPKGHVEIRRLGMSNFDHAIDPGFEDRLRNEAVWGATPHGTSTAVSGSRTTRSMSKCGATAIPSRTSPRLRSRS